MGWDYTKSKERIQRHLDNMGEIEIEKLKRDADLNSLLSETCCREIFGAHTYIHVSNFAALASGEIEDGDSYKRIVRAMHIYQREVSRIVETVFDGVRIHFQGAKLHALFFRPIDDAKTLASRAVLLQFVLKDFVSDVFNPQFVDVGSFKIAGGSDIGDAIGTKNGKRGDRELLFLGAPANHAAKIISTHGRLRITKHVYDELADDLREVCSPVDGDEDLYQLTGVSQGKLAELTDAYGIDWDRAASERRVKDDIEQFAIKDIAYSSATALIDIDSLSIYDNKRVLAASVFGDVTGFTAYIDSASTTDQKRTRLREFHAIRREMAQVVRDDFSGIRVQFQGDRVQAIVHLPKDDSAAIGAEAVDMAAGLQASMEQSLKDCLPAIRDKLNLAAGVDQETTLVTKLGTRAHRDRICLGSPVEEAAACEERCEGRETGVTKCVYDILPPRLKGKFSYRADRRCYVAVDLTPGDGDDPKAKARGISTASPAILGSDRRSA